VTNFRIAVGWKTKDKEGAEWISIVAFGKLAEICGQYLKKGSQVLIEGYLRSRKYTDKNGIERYATEIVANKMQMLGSKSDGQSSDRAASQAEAYGRGSAAPADTSSAGGGGDFDDDIPFMRVMGPW
jgi:single-strand DNA-binding protein